MPSCSFCGAADCNASSSDFKRASAELVISALRSCRIRVAIRMRNAEHELRAMVTARDTERGAEMRRRIMKQR